MARSRRPAAQTEQAPVASKQPRTSTNSDNVPADSLWWAWTGAGVVAALAAAAVSAAAAVHRNQTREEVVPGPAVEVVDRTPSQARLMKFFGDPAARNDTWLRSVQVLLEQGRTPQVIAQPLEQAVKLLRSPLLPAAVGGAWEQVSLAKDRAVSIGGDPALTADVAVIRARFAWVYHAQLYPLLRPNPDVQLGEVMRSIQGHAGAGDAAAGLLLARHGTRRVTEAIQLLQAAVDVHPDDDALRLSLAVAVAGATSRAAAVDLLRARATSTASPRPPHARLLMAFAFLAGTAERPVDSLEVIKGVLRRAVGQARTRAAAEASVMLASLQGSVPFDECQRIYELERDLLFSPSKCNSRLELGVLLRRIQGVPEAVSAGSELLRRFPFECPEASEQLSQMGKRWIQHKDASSGEAGLGGDVGAVAEIRTGIRDAQYAALLHDDADEIETSSQADVIRAAEHLECDFMRAGDSAARCAAGAAAARSSRPPELAKPAAGAAACPTVRPADFVRECLDPRRPCVLRGEAASFLIERKGASIGIDRWVDLSENATVRVSFPFPPTSRGGSPTLNKLERTKSFYADAAVSEDIKRMGFQAPNASALPWTLIRPSKWEMRLRDAAEWARRHPKPMYMNQQMLADLGSRAWDELRTPPWVAAADLSLVSPSLWLASGLVTTGFHYDALDNLLAQLSGSKEVLLASPSEIKNLYYVEHSDVQVGLARAGGCLANHSSAGLQRANGSSQMHSVIDVADAREAAKFPRYQKARTMTCKLEAGDVLFIPGFWHHAVMTMPDEECMGLSLNLWYTHPTKPPTLEKAVLRDGGSDEDLQADDRDWLQG